MPSTKHRHATCARSPGRTERLEQRLLLAGVTLTGSAGDDYLEIQTSGGNIIGKLNGFELFNVAEASIDNIVVNAGEGNDIIYWALAFDYADPEDTLIGSWDGAAYTGVTGMIQSGSNGGAWDGSGIVTSMSQGDGVTYAVGVAEASVVLGEGIEDEFWNGLLVDDTCVLVRRTYAGDIDLNGELNGDDYFFIDSNILQSGTVFGYAVGDINLDGEINGDDYFLIDSNILAAQAIGPI